MNRLLNFANSLPALGILEIWTHVKTDDLLERIGINFLEGGQVILIICKIKGQGF